MIHAERVSWETLSLPNLPIWRCKLPSDILAKLWKSIDAATESANNVLAGNITSSLHIEDTDQFFTKFLSDKLELVRTEYLQAYTFEENVKFYLRDFWVNYQKKHEFNPGHNHNGVVSFVIWLKIPTDWRTQHDLPEVKHSNGPCASDFEFVYSDILGRHHDLKIKLDKSSEGVMLVFPSELRHSVYPFYQNDGTRISVSGNFHVM